MSDKTTKTKPLTAKQAEEIAKIFVDNKIKNCQKAARAMLPELRELDREMQRQAEIERKKSTLRFYEKEQITANKRELIKCQA